MNAALRRQYHAIHQLARDEWPSDELLVDDAPDDLHNATQGAAQ